MHYNRTPIRDERGGGPQNDKRAIIYKSFSFFKNVLALRRRHFKPVRAVFRKGTAVATYVEIVYPTAMPLDLLC